MENFRDMDHWGRIENRLKEQWLRNNSNTSLTWEDVRESVKMGWMESKLQDRQPQSIH